MADFYYQRGDVPCALNDEKFKVIYQNETVVTTGLNLFYNEHTITQVLEGDHSVTVLGYVYKQNGDIQSYLAELLRNFTDDRIAEVKKELLGQYLVIMSHEDNIYLFSDFLQTRTIFYDTDRKMASSSFAALGATCTDEYKAFEYLAMRHCIYPSWLGNTTIDKRIRKVRSYEYLKINKATGEMESPKLQFAIDNSKIASFKEAKSYTLSLLRNVIRHPDYQNKVIGSTITGGFDSRLVTSLVNEYYSNVTLRVATLKGENSLDYKIATQVVKTMGLPLKVYETDLDTQKDAFYDLTDGLTPRENGLMMQFLQHVGEYDLGFGGAFGTELYTSIDFDAVDQLVTDFSNKARAAVKADDPYYKAFEKALRDEFENINTCFVLKEQNIKDTMRIFRLMITGFFSSQVMAAYNIYGRQFEMFGTFPVIEAGLRIPYEYMGSRTTFGRFYMVPKALVEQLNPKVSKIDTTHFCPMRPLSVGSFASYVLGKFKQKSYYKNMAKAQAGKNITLSYDSDRIKYTSNYWFEGFKQKYLTPKQ